MIVPWVSSTAARMDVLELVWFWNAPCPVLPQFFPDRSPLVKRGCQSFRGGTSIRDVPLLDTPLSSVFIYNFHFSQFPALPRSRPIGRGMVGEHSGCPFICVDIRVRGWYGTILVSYLLR